MSDGMDASRRKRWCGGKTQTALFTGVAVTLLGAWATHFFGPATPLSIPLPPAEKTVEELLAESRVSFADWQALVKENLQPEQRTRIFERYRGVRVVWQGNFAECNEILPEYGASSESAYLLVMYEDQATLNSTALGRAPALCVFPREAANRLRSLSRGQSIVVRGTFASPTLQGQLLGTKLYNCQLLAP